MSAAVELSLYERLGGREIIHKITKDVWINHISNPDVSARYANSDAEKIKHVQAGIGAIDKAISLNDQYMEALVYKNLLLRVQANLERNPARQQALLREATELSNRAEEIRKKAAAGAAGTSGRSD